jgi:lysozyme
VAGGLKMNKLEDVKRTCVELFLIPCEGTGPMTPDGRFMAYEDPGSRNLKVQDEFGNWVRSPEAGLPITIAWGLTYHADGTPIQLGETWTLEYATEVKAKVLSGFLSKLLGLSPTLATENILRIAAVLSWVYNIGLGNYRISTFKKRIDSKDWEGAASECLKWNKSKGKVMKGLTIRRNIEAKAILQSK